MALDYWGGRSHQNLDMGAGTGLLYELSGPPTAHDVALDPADAMLDQLLVRWPNAVCVSGCSPPPGVLSHMSRPSAIP